ncbi:tetratricopeptide repeat protein [Silvibacterium dinghuense]|uniref:Tetratricopeptide repeat protein n=1 Tax=Silvibacterium dinghuense TaxID=1560006 RepID=A0A4Q1SK60_9BACT|nr:tetratricopeptide repeat protein [Silvibacterium dinghuense]RXS98074.1 tetratricopeptide repeat protein [Silvibacterium dinghuense]
MRTLLPVALFLSFQAFGQTTPATPPLQAATPTAQLAQAEDAMKHGRNQDAVPILEALSQSTPLPKGVFHDLGLAYYRTGKLAEAQKAFSRAVQNDPSDEESVQMMGLTLFRMGQPANAIPYLEKVRQWTPNSEADANYVLGLCYMNSQRYDDARRAFAAQYGVAPDSGAAYLLTGNMLINANLPELAAAQAQKALVATPNLPMAHFLLGEVALFKSDIDGATKEFEAERALNPGYAPVYDRLGDTYAHVGKYQEAQEALMKAISLDTSRTGPFILMGKVLLRRNDPQSALLYLRHAEKMDPGNFITHTLIGQALRASGQEAEAKQEFDTAAKIHAAGELKLQPSP